MLCLLFLCLEMKCKMNNFNYFNTSVLSLLNYHDNAARKKNNIYNIKFSKEGFHREAEKKHFGFSKEPFSS